MWHWEEGGLCTHSFPLVLGPGQVWGGEGGEGEGGGMGMGMVLGVELRMRIGMGL